MITIQKVSKQYMQADKHLSALNNINLSINTGDIFGILGESGSGKSTLLRLIAGLEKLEQGEILIDNTNIKTLSSKQKQLLQQKISIIFQHFNLLNNLTVAENIFLPLKLQGHKLKNNVAKIKQILDFVHLGHKYSEYPAQLSGGEQQRVAIARALITNASILLCDEPTSALDMKTTHDILLVLKKINAEFNTTIVIVTHEIDVVKTICNKVAVLEQSKLATQKTIKNHLLMNQYSSYLDYINATIQE